jgi:hypothetical protein
MEFIPSAKELFYATCYYCRVVMVVGSGSPTHHPTGIIAQVTQIADACGAPQASRSMALCN